MNLVTIQEAMDFLKYDDEPPELALLIAAASAAVLNYLGEDATFTTVESDSEDYVIPPEVKQACLFWLREMDASREGEKADTIDPRFGYGYPPAIVVSLLSPLRVPRMA